MTDLERLDEAVADWVQEYVWLLQRHAPRVTLEPLEVVVDAARRYAAGTPLQWCETHDASAWSDICHIKDGYPSATLGVCSIVERWISDPLAREKEA